MATGGAWTSGSSPGLAVTVCGPERLVDRLPSGVSSATVAAAKRADVLVVDRRTADTRTEQTGEVAIADRQVLVVPARPGARPSVACYSTDDPETDPAVELVRRTIELDATAAAHYGVASAVAVASGGGDDTAPEEDSTAIGGGDDTASRAEQACLSPSAAELAVRRDSVDIAAARVLDDEPDAAVPLAFCGLAAVVEPLEGA